MKYNDNVSIVTNIPINKRVWGDHELGEKIIANCTNNIDKNIQYMQISQ